MKVNVSVDKILLFILKAIFFHLNVTFGLLVSKCLASPISSVGDTVLWLHTYNMYHFVERPP